MINTLDLIDNTDLSNSSIETLNRLMVKYELKKVLFTDYLDGYRINPSSKELSRDYYLKVIMLFLTASLLTSDVRYYNTALKISDKIKFKLPIVKYDILYEAQ